MNGIRFPEEITMTIYDIRKKAGDMGIRRFTRMRKPDLIRAIQMAEGNIPCFGTERCDYCRELSCLWRADCVELNRLRYPDRAAASG